MAVLQRVQVGAVLDLENLLFAARRTSGAAVRAQFLTFVEQLRGSGDGIFAPLVASQALAGRHTVVIGRPGCISSALRAAAHQVIELPLRDIHLGAAA